MPQFQTRRAFLYGTGVVLFVMTLSTVLMLTPWRGSASGRSLQGPMPDPTALQAHIPAFKHIFLIVMENKPASMLADPRAAPYTNQLAAQFGRATNFYGTRHPSLPNYLALTGGNTFGITTNCVDCTVDAPNLVDQLEGAGKTWKAYIESLPTPCYVGDSPPLYRQKHNPFIYYANIRNDPARCQRIVPFDQFATDVQTNSLPDFVWITPNMCNDTHDCAIGTGDAWLQQVVPSILNSAAWKDQGVLFITYDEGTGPAGCCSHAAGGQIDTLIISPLGIPGSTSNVPYDHYSLLRTIEMAWSLPLLGNAACDCTAPLGAFFPQDYAARDRVKAGNGR